MASTLLDAKKLCATTADNGLNMSDPRLVDRINESQRRLIRHYNFLVRREEYDRPPIVWTALVNDTDNLLMDDLDATKIACLALWREENNATDDSGKLELRAQQLVEENLVSAVEAVQKVAWQTALTTCASGTFGYAKARLGLDLADVALRLSDARIGRLINAALGRLIRHYNYLVRKEEYDRPSLASTLLVANTDALPLDDLEAIKLMCLSLWSEEKNGQASAVYVAQGNTALDASMKLENRALQLIEETLIATFETAQKLTWQTNLTTCASGTFGYAKARLGLDLATTTLRLSDTRMGRYLNAAQERLIRQYNFFVRKEEYDRPAIVWVPLSTDTDVLLLNDLEASKLMCVTLWSEENTPDAAPPQGQQAAQQGAQSPDATGKSELRAQQLIEENIVSTVEAAQKVEWQAALASYPPGTFGYAKARLGLDLADATLRLSDARVGRAVNAAEEVLLEKGKAVGTIKEYKFEVREKGLITLPPTVEAVLYATMGEIAAPVYRQAYDWLDNGPGYQTADALSHGWNSVLVARGLDDDGNRVFFVRNQCPDRPVRMLCKVRFFPHTDNTERMIIRNYAALRAMTISMSASTTDPAKAAAFEAMALQLIDDELAEHRGGEETTMPFHIKGAARPVKGLR